MDIKELQELIQLISDSNLAEFKLEDGDLKLSIRTKHYISSKIVPPTQVAAAPIMPMPTAVQPLQQPVMAPAITPAPTNEETNNTGGGNEEDTSRYVEIKSPIVGTFYRSPSPDKPPFVSVGDTVSSSSVVCIVEAMKLFNEIEAEVSGRIVKVLIDDASPVEYDQALFIVDPNG